MPLPISSSYVWQGMARVVDQYSCGASARDLVCINCAIILVELLGILGIAFEALHTEAKSFGFQISWTKKKKQMSEDFLDERVESVHSSVEDTDILEMLTYFVSVAQNNGVTSTTDWLGP